MNQMPAAGATLQERGYQVEYDTDLGYWVARHPDGRPAALLLPDKPTEAAEPTPERVFTWFTR